MSFFAPCHIYHCPQQLAHNHINNAKGSTQSLLKPAKILFLPRAVPIARPHLQTFHSNAQLVGGGGRRSWAGFFFAQPMFSKCDLVLMDLLECIISESRHTLQYSILNVWLILISSGCEVVQRPYRLGSNNYLWCFDWADWCCVNCECQYTTDDYIVRPESSKDHPPEQQKSLAAQAGMCFTGPLHWKAQRALRNNDC